MEAYAVIETGGKQYRVQQNDVVHVELLGLEAGAAVEFDVLAINDGTDLKIGAPLVDGVKVKAIVIEDFRDKKIVAFKKKRRKGFKKKIGHRQNLTKIKIEAIGA